MTNQDLYLVIGVIISALALPSIIGAWAESRAPRVAIIAVVVGGGLILLAASQTEGGFQFADIPEAFIRVVAYIVR